MKQNINGVVYALRAPVQEGQAKIEMYDLDTCYLGAPLLVGHLVLKKGSDNVYDPIFL